MRERKKKKKKKKKKKQKKRKTRLKVGSDLARITFDLRRWRHGYGTPTMHVN